MGRPLAAAGVLLAAAFVIACGGDSDDDPSEPLAQATQLVVQPQITAVASPTQSTAPTAAAASPTVEPTPAPRTYIVQPGDTLTGICRAEIPDMAEENCVTETVAMNGLPNASQISVGQELLLPAAGNQPEPSLPAGSAAGSGSGSGAGQGSGSGSGAAPAPGSGSGYSGPALVTRVVDGDTLEVDLGGPVLVRLLGIDTPEGLANPPVCYGQEASAYTKQLAEGQTVTLEIDSRDTDAEGRLLRYVHLPTGAMLNELLLQNGYAQVVVMPPDVRYLARFLNAAKQARDAGLGMWSAC